MLAFAGCLIQGITWDLLARPKQGNPPRIDAQRIEIIFPSEASGPHRNAGSQHVEHVLVVGYQVPDVCGFAGLSRLLRSTAFSDHDLLSDKNIWVSGEQAIHNSTDLAGAE